MVRQGVVVLMLVVGASALARGDDSCEPDHGIREPRAIEAALARCEETAHVSTVTQACYAALCRGAAYAFALAEPGGDRSSDLARKGYELADQARKLVPGRVEGHYQYAICLGIYLRENKLSGITRVSDMVDALKRAVEVDERYDHGGPHRALAIIYAEAPRIVSAGDRDLARKHLARLLAIAGDDEDNKLAAVRVRMECGDTAEARVLLESVKPQDGEHRAERDRLKKQLDD